MYISMAEHISSTAFYIVTLTMTLGEGEVATPETPVYRSTHVYEYEYEYEVLLAIHSCSYVYTCS